MGPVLADFQTITEPLSGVFDVLNEPLPVLTDLSNAIGEGDVTLMGLALKVAPAASASDRWWNW